MGIEVDDRDRSIDGLDGTKNGEHNSVISTQSDDTRVMFPVQREGLELNPRRVLREWRERLALKQILMPILDLLDRVLVIVRRHRDITTVDDLQLSEGVDTERDVVPSVEPQAPGPSADARRSKASTRAVARSRVKGRADERYVEGVLGILVETLDPRKLGEGRDSGEHRISRDFLTRAALVRALPGILDVAQGHLLTVLMRSGNDDDRCEDEGDSDLHY